MTPTCVGEKGNDVCSFKWIPLSIIFDETHTHPYRNTQLYWEILPAFNKYF